MVHISSPITQEWIAANERAATNRQAGRIVTRNADGAYSAPSSKGDGTTYTVTVVNVGTLSAVCDCPHGQHADARGKCWHCAAALAAEVRRVSRKSAPAADRTAGYAAHAARLGRGR